MSLSVARSDGVTVLTLTSDPSSTCPPFCQLLGALCYSPGLCSSSRRLTLPRRGAQAVLGALWIIAGILHIGLGVILITNRGVSMYMMRDTYCPVWMGVLSMLFGTCCILTERYPRPITALLSGILNLTGVALSITSAVWYSYGGFRPHYCQRDYYEDYWDRHETTTTVSPERDVLQGRCEEARDLARILISGVKAVMICLSVLDICLGLSSASLSFIALKRGMSESGSKPLLQEGEGGGREGEGGGREGEGGGVAGEE